MKMQPAANAAVRTASGRICRAMLGKGASNRISSASGIVKWRMLMSKWLSMSTPTYTISDTQRTRQWI